MAAAGLNRCVIRRQVDLAQQQFAHVGGVVLTAGLGSTVGGKMLDRGGNGVWRREAVALVAADIGTSDGGAQVGVFARALGAAAPSSIARDVDHG